MDLIQLMAQYGPWGIAAFLTWCSWRTQERLAKALDEQQERHAKAMDEQQQAIIELVRTSTTAIIHSSGTMETLLREIRERPCLRERE